MLSSSSSSVFENLPTRPPTPPRDVSTAVDDAISFLDDSNEIEQALRKPRGIAPPQLVSPSRPAHSSQELPPGSGGAKRVGFTPVPTYHQIARAGQVSSPSSQLYKRAPAAKYAKPVKSILKQSNQPPPLTPDDLETKLSYFSPQDPGSFGKMLQSVVQQLAGPKVSARLDAYLALNGALQAYDGVPDPQAMAAKMGLLMQFLARDIVWKQEVNGALDMNIISQALKLTLAIMFDPKLSAAMDDDFRTFLIERSITTIEHDDVPKAIVKAHMYLLAQQRFQAPAMSYARADRTVTALKTLEKRCSGNQVIGSKFVIYQRLLVQAPKVMLQRMRDWLGEVINGMLSDVKDIRTRAIATAHEAGLTFGEQPHASKLVMDLLDSEMEEEGHYCEYLRSRLLQMLSDKDASTYVPQIWAAIVLLFRNKRYPVERWPYFKSWLQVIQKCLNSSNLTTRYHAYLAWNQLAFAVLPDGSTSRNMLAMLKIPATSAIDMKKSEPNAKQISRFALESYYNVLHYALRPGLSFEELDVAWDTLVEPVLGEMIGRKNSRGKALACGVLHGLCKANAGSWNVRAAFEPTAIRPEELPRLEPKWVRSRLAKFLALLKPVLTATMWDQADINAAVDATWAALMQSVAEAGAQEIKTSNELKEAIAALVGLWRSVWTGGIDMPAGAVPDTFTARYASLISSAVQCMGSSSFAEEIIARTKDDSIHAALTPSHRSSKHHDSPQSPLVFLFGLLYHPPPHVDPSGQLSTTADMVLSRLALARPSASARLELLAKSSQHWHARSSVDSTPMVSAFLWATIAKRASLILSEPSTVDNTSDAQNLGQQLRNASTVLAQGVRHISNTDAAIQSLRDLLYAMLSAAKAGAGAGGAAIAVTEPFAKSLSEGVSTMSDTTRLHLADHLLASAVWPRSRQEVEQAKKALWGVWMAPHKAAASFDPYDQVYEVVNSNLVHMYTNLEVLGGDVAGKGLEFFASVLNFLECCPLSLLAVALRRTQAGMALWIGDAERKTDASPILSRVVQDAWRKLLHLVEQLPSKDSTLLQALEPLLVAGLSSPHKTIVNDALAFWNRIFGEDEELEYPSQLVKVLAARAAETDVALAAVPDVSREDIDLMRLPEFFETQFDDSRSNVMTTSNEPTSASPNVSKLSAKQTASAKRKMRKGPKAKLRHDDSQIQFAPIDSSPIAPTDDSQMLTEHQKETKARQSEVAKMFPDLSSSPAAEQRAARVQKRLNFTSDEKDEAGTPVRVADDGHMSDDIPSSPTPSSTKDADSAPIQMDEDGLTDDNEIVQDPPSSPPAEVDEIDEPEVPGPDPEHLIAITGTAKERDVLEHVESEPDMVGEDVQADTAAGAQATPVQPNTQDSDLPSDTVLPNEQLEYETEQAVGATETPIVGDSTEGTTFYPAGNARESAMTAEPSAADASVQQELLDDSLEDVTRIENSFVQAPIQEKNDLDDQAESSQKSTRSARKRKRSSESARPSKKRKSQSPVKSIKGFFSSFFSNQGQQDDDDMEDEIVVASSQPSTSPEALRRIQKAPSPIVEVPVRSTEVQITLEAEAISQRPQKRGPGRPRKSETPTPVPSQSDKLQKRGLKRGASALSQTDELDERATMLVKDTPAPTKARKQRQGPDAKLVKAARLSQDQSDSRRSTRRSMANDSEMLEVTEAPDDQEQATSQDKLAEVAAAPSPQRAIATPRSILGRLRDVLSDLPKMILGGQEERELDDVLFEIRREVHEASRRGRK